MSQSSRPCLSSGHHSQRKFKKEIEDFDCKINGRAPEAALRPTGLSLGGLDGQAQTQGVSLWAAVAAGYNRLALRKCATTLAILT